MPKLSPALPKGFEDHDMSTICRRRYITDVIQKVYERYGFNPLETPVLEHLSTLTGNYGDEGDKLIFKVLNSGNFLSNITLEDKDEVHALGAKIANKGLRYDLTVPLMRYVAAHSGTLTFPFRRYQIQSVFRADRPQKGRLREFTQCDADVVGTPSLICEAESIAMAHEIMYELGLQDFVLHLNHRSILRGLADLLGIPESVLCVSMDKLDKIGTSGVMHELSRKGISVSSLSKLESFLENLSIKQNILEYLDYILIETSEGQKGKGQTSEGQKGLSDLRKVLQYTKALSPISVQNVRLDPTLARGLSYYTGTVFELKIPNSDIGSVGGGGRYDDFTSVYGISDMTGFGFSLGLDRLYAILLDRTGFQEVLQGSITKVLVTNLSETLTDWVLGILAKFRHAGIPSIVYPTVSKLKKQLQYANYQKIPWVLLIGQEEYTKGEFVLRDMQSGEQYTGSIDKIIYKLKTN